MSDERISGLRLLEALGFECTNENLTWADINTILFDKCVYTGSQVISGIAGRDKEYRVYRLTTWYIPADIETNTDGCIYQRLRVVIECNRINTSGDTWPCLDFFYNPETLVFQDLYMVDENMGTKDTNVNPCITDVYFYSPDSDIGDPSAVEIIYGIMKRNNGGYFDIHCDELGFSPKFEINTIMDYAKKKYLVKATKDDLDDYTGQVHFNNWTILYGTFMVIKKYLEMVEFAKYQEQEYTHEKTFNFKEEKQ